MKYSLGLDIGISSVGWAVLDLDKQRIHDLGVRIFEKAENPQGGGSLSKSRRDARSARRRLRRRRQRLNNLKKFFIDNNLLTSQQISEILDPNSKYNHLDVYNLRHKALERALSAEELFKVFYQIAKRRGFKSNRKIEKNQSSSENGKVLEAIKENKQFLADNHYVTAGSALAKDSRFSAHQRNKTNSYNNSFDRADFLNELEKIIEFQKKFTLKDISSEKIHHLIYGLSDDGQVINHSAIMYQRPFMTEALINKMVGRCTFENNEKRAPKASYSFELFRLANELKNLSFVPKDKNIGCPAIKLSSAQISTVIDSAKNGSLTYKKVRQISGIEENYIPNNVRGKKGDDFGESNKLLGFSAYLAIKSKFKTLPEDWQKIDNEHSINQIAYILTVNKSDDEIKEVLTKSNLPLSEAGKDAILEIPTTNFKAFAHLSIKALQNITPHILAGEDYDVACELVGYDFRKQALDLDQITNPIVKRAISQTSKVVRAIERKYGYPYFIKVELAREIAKSYKERVAIDKENRINYDNNQKIVNEIKEAFGITSPTGNQIIKMKLFREQNSKCLYSGKEIDVVKMLTDDNAYQIDHILPLSRSNIDSLANKVLVLTSENQQKADHIPFEYFGSDSKRWSEFVARVESTYPTRDVKTNDGRTNRDNYKYNSYAFRKKSYLLAKEYSKNGWDAKDLNNTRYIVRFVQNYLKQTVKFADGEGKQRVFAPNGAITAYLRRRLGLNKDRDENVLHHAVDAAIVASVDQGLIQRINVFAKKIELKYLLMSAQSMYEKEQILLDEKGKDSGLVTSEKKAIAKEVLSSEHFSGIWPDFAKELRKRSLSVDAETLRNELIGLDNYDEEFRLSVKPIFVSRMPRRKVVGKIHDETLRSPKIKKDNDFIYRFFREKIDEKLTREKIEHSKLKESDCWLYDKLISRLDQTQTFDSKNKPVDHPEKAFAEPIYKNDKKFDKNGKPISPVSAIKVYYNKPNGLYLNKGKSFAENSSMVRLDVYNKKDTKGRITHFFVPVYSHQIGKNKPTPTKAFPSKKNIDSSFTKVCSLYPNDYVVISFNDKKEEGYYLGYDISTGAITLMKHDTSNKDSKFRCSPRQALSIKRFDISILGDNTPEQ